MVVEVSRAGAKFRLGLPVHVTAAFAKALIRRLIITCEIQIVLDERCAGVRIIADTIPSDPGVQQRKRYNKDDEQDVLVSALLNLDLGIQARINPPQKAALRPAGTPPFQGILQESANQVAGSLL